MVLYGITVFIWWVTLLYIVVFIVAYRLMAGDEQIVPKWLNWLMGIMFLVATISYIVLTL